MPDLPLSLALGITTLEPGGAEQCLTELAARLPPNRFRVEIYCLGPRPGPARLRFVRRLEDLGIPLHFFGARHWSSAPSVLLRWTRALRRQRPALLQTFLWHANLLGRLAARLAGVPHVLSGHRAADPRSALRHRLDRWTDGLVERHVCVSQSVADFAQAHGLPPRKLCVIPNGIDRARFATARPWTPAESGLPEGRRWLLFVGRLEPQKGLVELWPEIAHFLSDFRNHDLLVAGSGSQENLLKQRIHGLGLSNRVHFLGRRDDVPELLAACDVVLVPSHWEGLPNIVLEAQAAGKPLVAWAVPGVAEALGPDPGPQLVPLQDQSAFAEAVRLLASDPSLCARLGERNRAHAATLSDWDSMTAAYARLYEELCD